MCYWNSEWGISYTASAVGSGPQDTNILPMETSTKVDLYSDISVTEGTI